MNAHKCVVCACTHIHNMLCQVEIWGENCPTLGNSVLLWGFCPGDLARGSVPGIWFGYFVLPSTIIRMV